MMMRALLFLVCALPVTAEAKATLRGIGGEVGEVTHDVTIDLRAGAIATVETKQSVVATSLDAGVTQAEAVYTFDLPSSAAIVDLEVTLANGKRGAGQVVGATAALETTSAPTNSQPDSALLRMIELDGERARYELRVFPIASQRTTQWTIKWLLPVRHISGVGVLRMPPRGQSDNLVNETVTVRNIPRRYSSIIGSGRKLGSGRSVRFKGSPLYGVVAELHPRAGATSPALEFATAALSSDRSATLIRIAAGNLDRRNDVAAERVVFVIDTSKSMGQSRALAEKLTAALLDDAPAGAEIAAIAFAREAENLLGGFAANTSASRQRLLAALGDIPARSGTDLAGALALTDRLLAGSTEASRVILISDGITPTTQTAKEIAHSVGTEFLTDVRVAHIAIIPENAPLLRESDLGASSLTRRKGSRMLALRTSSALGEADHLWRTLWTPPPLRDIALADESKFLGEQPNDMAPGSDVVLSGFFRGQRPASMQLTAAAETGEIVLRGRQVRALEKMVLPLTVATAQTLPTGWDDMELSDVASKAHVVSRDTSLLVPYPGDRFAAERLRLSRQFGASQFRRVAPEIEDELVSYMFTAPPPSIHSVPSAPPDTPSGTLDRSIAERLVYTHVIAKARGCYKRALIPSKNLRGELTLVFEMARGEVHDVRIVGSLQGDPKWAAEVESCVVDAAYSIQVPTVQQGSDGEAITVVRYPLRFRIVDAKGRIVPAETRPKSAPQNDPLEGL